MASTVNPTTPTSAPDPRYDHTQHGPLVWLLLVPALVALSFVALTTDNETDLWAMRIGFGVVAFFAFSFTWLRIFDDGDALVARFGPLPLFGKRIPYADIASAARDRSSLVDGWGIHWVPCRGWTYNLWGFDCVRLTLHNRRTLRFGTDDPDGLEKFLRQQCGSAAANGA